MKTGNTTIVPFMTSNTTPSGVASASSVESASYQAWRAFDNGASGSQWHSMGKVNEWIQYKFDNPQVVGGYRITIQNVGTSPKEWELRASNDGSNWTVLDAVTENWSSLLEVKSYAIDTSKIGSYLYYRLYIFSNSLSNFARIYIVELELLGVEYDEKSIVLNNAKYLYWDTSWKTLGNPITESDYLEHGMDDTSIIPESAWKELNGDVEIHYWTDNPNKSEVSFTIETEPFALEDEWDNKEIKVLEYTDNPVKNESIVTLETQPFTIYDEVGEDGSLDILYYTDNTSVQSADLEVKNNYSPLDEINDDFSVIVWTNENSFSEDNVERDIVVDALPKGQLIINENPVFYGDIKSIVASDIGYAKYLLSFDDGVTWNVYRRGWRSVDISDRKMILRYGMTSEELNKVPRDKFEEKSFEGFRIAYYIDESVPESKIESVKVVSNANQDDVKFEDLAFYLLNTTATINVTFAGNKLSGVLDDEDKGKVKYRVLLNGNPYYPVNGEFSQLVSSPHDINIVIDDRRINFGVQNSLTVEFQDYWGEVDSWSATFIGTHSGLVFTDEFGSFYTTAFGEVLKYLDFGEIIAGQTTLDQKVILKNNIGYPVKDIRLVSEQMDDNKYSIELSKEQSPFLANSELFYPDVLDVDGEIPFYVRISTELTAEPNPNVVFKVRLNADKAV